MKMAPDEPNRDKYHVPAVESALDVVEVLAASPYPRSISDLAGAVNKSPGQLFRILTTLERRGYVAKIPSTGHYEITLRLLHLAHVTSPMRRLAPAAAPLMRKLSDEIGQSCHLSVLEGGEMVVVHEVSSPQAVRLVIDVGARHPILDTLAGRVVLAGMEPETRALVMDADERLRALSRNARSELEAELELIARQGYAARHSGLHTGVDDYTVAVGQLAHQPLAALTITTLERIGHQHEVDVVIEHLLKTGQEISTALGQQLPVTNETNE